MSGAMETGLLIGCFGYDHPQWTPEPYPEDLPAGWRFCYYSNEVHSVVLPASLLADSDDERVQVWTDDCDDDFRFVLELTPGLLGAQPDRGFASLRKRLAPIANRLAAAMVVGPVPTQWLDTLVDTIDLALCSTVVGATPGHLWYPAQLPASSLPGEGVILAMVEECGLKEMRSIIERLGRQNADTGLFFCDPGNAWRQVRQAQQLADLLGVARGW